MTALALVPISHLIHSISRPQHVVVVKPILTLPDISAHVAWVPAITQQPTHCCLSGPPVLSQTGSNDPKQPLQQAECVFLNPVPGSFSIPNALPMYMPQYKGYKIHGRIYAYPSLSIHLHSPSFRAHTLLASCCNQLNLICSRGRIFRPMNHTVAECLRPGQGLHYCRLASTTTVRFRRPRRRRQRSRTLLPCVYTTGQPGVNIV